MGEEIVFELDSEAARELIRLTNGQFGFWAECLRRESGGDAPSGHAMDFWFVLSNLVLAPDFSINKKDAYDFIPNLAPETVRKYVSRAQGLGLVETSESRKTKQLRLTAAGQRAVSATLNRWTKEFRRIQRMHFPDVEDSGSKAGSVGRRASAVTGSRRLRDP